MAGELQEASTGWGGEVWLSTDGTAANLMQANYDLALRVFGAEDTLTWRFANNLADVLRGLGAMVVEDCRHARLVVGDFIHHQQRRPPGIDPGDGRRAHRLLRTRHRRGEKRRSGHQSEEPTALHHALHQNIGRISTLSWPLSKSEGEEPAPSALSPQLSACSR